MQYTDKKGFQSLKEFTIKKIYAPYRFGMLKVGDRYEPHTYKNKDGQFYREYWSKNSEGKNTRMLATEPTRFSKDDYSKFKKVFDIVVETPDVVSVPHWKGEPVSDNEFTINALSSSVIKQLLSTIDYDAPVNDDGYEEYDYEDKATDLLIDKSFSMKVIMKKKMIGEREAMVPEYKMKAVEFISADEVEDAIN